MRRKRSDRRRLDRSRRAAWRAGRPCGTRDHQNRATCHDAGRVSGARREFGGHRRPHLSRRLGLTRSNCTTADRSAWAATGVSSGRDPQRSVGVQLLQRGAGDVVGGPLAGPIPHAGPASAAGGVRGRTDMSGRVVADPCRRQGGAHRAGPSGPAVPRRTCRPLLQRGDHRPGCGPVAARATRWRTCLPGRPSCKGCRSAPAARACSALPR
jgi:hypothetical protein